MRSAAAFAAVGLCASLALLPSAARADAPADPADPLAARRAPAAPDPFAVLREVGRSWTYEATLGPSIAKLAVAPGGAPVRCTVAPWPAPASPAPAGSGVPAGIERSTLACGRADQSPGAPQVDPGWTLWLVFDAAGVRQVDDGSADLSDRGKTLGLTFPRVLDGRWRFDERGRAGWRTRVMVREETQQVLGAARRVWIAETERWAPPVGNKPTNPERYVVHYAPGLGPVLVCAWQELSSVGYSCLRLIAAPDPASPGPASPADPVATRPAPPQGSVSIASKQAHDPSTLTAAQVAAKIAQAYSAGARRCYQPALARRPALRGTLTLAFTVNAVGKTTEVSAKGFDDGIASCVAKQAVDWRFPIPQSTYAEPRNARFTIGLAFAP